MRDVPADNQRTGATTGAAVARTAIARGTIVAAVERMVDAARARRRTDNIYTIITGSVTSKSIRVMRCSQSGCEPSHP